MIFNSIDITSKNVEVRGDPVSYIFNILTTKEAAIEDINNTVIAAFQQNIYTFNIGPFIINDMKVIIRSGSLKLNPFFQDFFNDLEKILKLKAFI